jgi:hypothetical protein
MLIDWQEQVRSTEIMRKHEHVVENILRDKNDGWRHDYYKDTTTGYDLHVGRAQIEVSRYKAAIKKHEGALEKITARLDASTKEPREPGVKKLTPKETEALEAEYIDIYKLKCELLVFLDGAEKSLQELAWKQYLQKKRLMLLQALRNDFMLNGDADYMARGVTWVEEYIANLREKMV